MINNIHMKMRDEDSNSSNILMVEDLVQTTFDVQNSPKTTIRDSMASIISPNNTLQP